MDKSLFKLYVILSLGFAIALATFPTLLNRLSDTIELAVTRARLQAYNNSADSKGSLPDPGKGKIVIVMDDGWESQFSEGFSILKRYGYRACIAVIPAAVGHSGYMSYSQLAELYMDGWDLLNHTYNHSDLAGLPEDAQKDQIRRAKKWLRDHGFNRGSEIVVYPQGKVSAQMASMLKAEEIVAARSLKSLWIRERDGTAEDVEVLNLISGITFSEVMTAIDSAIRNHSALILVMHKIEKVDNDSQMQFGPLFFENIVAYIDSRKSEATVVTMTELLSIP